MRKTTVFLDAGGVLLDEAELETFICHTITELLQTEGLLFEESDYWADTQEAIGMYCPITPRYVLWKRADHDMALYARLYSRYQTSLKGGRPALKLYDAMLEEIPKMAQRFKLVYAGQYGEDVFDLLDSHDLTKHFVNRLSQDNFAVTKPDPRYLVQIAEKAGVPIEAGIVVGDRIDKDIIPALQNEMGTVFVRTGIYKDQPLRLPEERPELTLDSLEGLADAITARWGD